MKSVSPSAPSRSRFHRRGLVAVGFQLLLGGAQITSVGTIGYCWARGHFEWKEAQRRLAASGYALAVEDIARGPVPDAENFGATPALLGIATREQDQTPEIKAKIKRLENLNPLPSKLKGTPDAPKPEGGFEPSADWKALRRWLAGPMKWNVPEKEPNDAKAVLAALRSRDAALVQEIFTAARRPRAVLTPAEYARVRDMLTRKDPVPDMVPANLFLPASRHFLLRLEASLAAGDHTEVPDLLTTAFTLIRYSGSDHAILSWLIGTTVERMFHDVLRKAIAARQLTETEVASCQEFLTAVNGPHPLNTALLMEVAQGVRLIRTVVEAGINQTDFFGPVRTAGLPRAHDLMERIFVQGSSAYIVDAFLSRAKYLEKGDWTGAIAEEKAREGADARMSWLDQTRLALGRGHAFGFSALLPKAAQTEYQRRLLIAACALERHRLRGNKLPDTLTALPPDLLAAVPLDMDGQPVRYLRTADGFVLWSVGLNLQDDWHGAPPPAGTKQDAGPSALADWQIRIR